MDQRVPKKLLLENGAPTAADKRQINDGIEELLWLAALKPTTIGVPDYRDDVREYLEIAVLSLDPAAGAKGGRLMELIHRAIPYPVLLLSRAGRSGSLSLAHKRWSQGETGKMVLEGAVTSCEWDASTPAASAFLRQPGAGRAATSASMALYQGWIDSAASVAGRRVTGVSRCRRSPNSARSGAKRSAEHARLTRRLRACAPQAEEKSR